MIGGDKTQLSDGSDLAEAWAKLELGTERDRADEPFLKKCGKKAAELLQKLSGERGKKSSAADFVQKLKNGELSEMPLEKKLSAIEVMSESEQREVFESDGVFSLMCDFEDRLGDIFVGFDYGEFRSRIGLAVCLQAVDALKSGDEGRKKAVGNDVKKILASPQSGAAFGMYEPDGLFCQKKTRELLFSTFELFDEVPKSDIASTFYDADLLIEHAADAIGDAEHTSVAARKKIMVTLANAEKYDDFWDSLPADKRPQFDKSLGDWIFANDDKRQDGDPPLSAISMATALTVRRRSFELGMEARGVKKPEHSFVNEMFFGRTQLAKEAVACEPDDKRLDRLGYFMHNEDLFVQNLGFRPRGMEDFGAYFEEIMRKKVEYDLLKANDAILQSEGSGLSDEEKSKFIDPWLKRARADMCRVATGLRPGRIMHELIGAGVLQVGDEAKEKLLAEKGLDDLRDFDIEDLYEDRVVGGLSLSEKVQEMPNDDKLVILAAEALLFEKNKNPQDDIDALRELLDQYRSSSIADEMGDVLSRIGRERRREVTRALEAKIKAGFAEAAKHVGFVEAGEGDNVEQIEVLRMDGKSDALMLITNVGIFNTGSMNANARIEHPEQWNGDRSGYNVSKELRKTKPDGTPIGYLSASVISPRKQAMAARKPSEMQLTYGLLDLGPESVQYVGSEDIWTAMANDGGYERGVGEAAIRLGAVNIPTTPEEALSRTQFYNEFALDRFGSGSEEFDGRIQPGYIVVHSGDMAKIPDFAKKHAKYFRRKVRNPKTGQLESKPVPIVLLDPADGINW